MRVGEKLVKVHIGGTLGSVYCRVLDGTKVGQEELQKALREHLHRAAVYRRQEEADRETRYLKEIHDLKESIGLYDE